MMKGNEMRTLVTGGTGMVGSAFKKHEPDGVIRVGSSDYDLLDANQCFRMIMEVRPEAIIHLAGRVGGIKGNIDRPGDFYRDNIVINTNVLETARILEVPKVLSLLSTCVYPEEVRYPLTENQIHNGPPHASNFSYAYAKRMLDVQSRAYRNQYGCNFITAVPNNLYGPNDNFDLDEGHVIPAMIRKIYEAKCSGGPVKMWGSGTALREFTYSEDIADVLMYTLRHYEGSTPINIGFTEETSIRALAETLCSLLGYHGKLQWDDTMPTGQHKKPSSNRNLLELGWNASRYTRLCDGLKFTCDWFVKNYPNVRGVE
jgi:GDP-L-fucose synthase